MSSDGCIAHTCCNIHTYAHPRPGMAMHADTETESSGGGGKLGKLDDEKNEQRGTEISIGNVPPACAIVQRILDLHNCGEYKLIEMWMNVCTLTSSRDVMVCLHCGIRETKVDVVGEL